MSVKEAADAARAAESALSRRDSLVADSRRLQDELSAIETRIEAEQSAYERAVASLKRVVSGLGGVSAEGVK